MSQLQGNPIANLGVNSSGIGGSLNFGAVPAFGIGGYAQAYQNALSLNQQNYANILAGYQQTAASQAAGQQQIQAGYGNLYNTVLSGIQGIGESQAQAIRDQYAQQSGGAAQQLINSGLGNTTVQQSVQRGLSLDQQKAQIALANQLAQLQAGYQSNLGQAGLNFANQANQQRTALSGQQLGFMNSVNSPYPNTAAYAQLAQQQGAAQMAQRYLPGMMGQAYGPNRGANVANFPGGAGLGGGGGFQGLGGFNGSNQGRDLQSGTGGGGYQASNQALAQQGQGQGQGGTDQAWYDSYDWSNPQQAQVAGGQSPLQAGAQGSGITDQGATDWARYYSGGGQQQQGPAAGVAGVAGYTPGVDEYPALAGQPGQQIQQQQGGQATGQGWGTNQGATGGYGTGSRAASGAGRDMIGDGIFMQEGALDLSMARRKRKKRGSISRKVL